MPHQFLHNLELGPSSAEQGRVCPAECVPPYALRDAQLLRDRANVMMKKKKLLSPIRVLSAILRAGEHPTLRRSIECSAAPVPQITDQMIVEGHGFLRSLVLHFPTTCCTIERMTQSCLFLKSTSFHFSPNSSLCLSPVATSSKTMIRSRGSSAASSCRTSLQVRTSGALRRLALCRTH